MTKIEIINRALLKLGEAPVSSINEVAYGKSYEIVYDDVRKLMLSSYPWRFAVGIKRLSRDEKLYNKKYKYRLPYDCLLLLKVCDGGSNALDYRIDYEIADNFVVTDTKSGVVVEYVRNVENNDNFSALFREALASKIASELSMRVKHSLELKQLLDNEFYNLIRQAELNNEIIKDVENLPDNSWIMVRKVF